MKAKTWPYWQERSQGGQELILRLIVPVVSGVSARVIKETDRDRDRGLASLKQFSKRTLS